MLKYSLLRLALFWLYADYYSETDPIVYLRTICPTSVLEVAIMLLLGFGIIALARFRRKFKK